MIEKIGIPFLGVQKNVDERELTIQFAELKNCLINIAGHLQVRPGTTSITIPALRTDEEVVKNYYWGGAKKHVFVTNQGRVFEYYQISGQTYGITELADLQDFVGNLLFENDPGIAAGYTLKKIVVSNTGNYFACIANYPVGSGLTSKILFMTEADGIITFTNYDLEGASHSDIIGLDIAPIFVPWIGTDNITVSFIATSTTPPFPIRSVLCIYTPALGLIKTELRLGNQGFFNLHAHHSSNSYIYCTRGENVVERPKYGYHFIDTSQFIWLGDIPNTVINQPVPASASVVDPANPNNLKIFYGMDENYIEVDTITGAAPGAHVWSRITLLANPADKITFMDFDYTTNILLIGTELGLLYEATIGTNAQWLNPSLNMVYNFGKKVFSVNRKIVNTINYWYVGLDDGMYMWKEGFTSPELLLYNPESSEADYKNDVADIISVTHGTGKKGFMFANRNNTDGKVFVVYPDSADTVEGFTPTTEYNIKLAETDKLKIDPADANEVANVFLFFLFQGRLVYYKLNETAGKVRFYYDPTIPGYTTDEIAPIQAIAYTDGLLVLSYQDNNRFTWSRPLEILHFDETVYQSANYSPTPNLELETSLGQVFIFSAQDTEIWCYTPNAEHDKLMSRIGVIQSGLFAKRSVFKIPGFLGWMDQNRNIVISDGNEPKPLPNSLLKEFFKISGTVNCIAEYARIENVEFLFFTFPDENKTYVFDMFNDFFYEWDGFKVASSAFDIQAGKSFAVIDNTLKNISLDITTDDAADISVTIRTPWMDRASDEYKICWALWFTIVKETTDTDYIQVRKRTKINGAWSHWRSVPLNTLGQYKKIMPRFGRYQRIQYEIRYSGSHAMKILSINEYFERLDK